jgi:trehalose 6-phosphate phosphatase
MSSSKPSTFKAAILDMDGVITQTATLHAKAWKQMFDEFLEKHQGKDYTPLDIHHDYRNYIDGKPRFDGVRSFLASRDIELPEGSPEDDPGKETVYGLGMRKNEIFLELLEKEGVQVYQDTEKMVRQWKEEGIKLAVISSSRNCKRIMEAAGLIGLFEVLVDGEVSKEKELKGKPEPDIFLEASEQLGVDPAEAIVVEDAISGVEAGKKGKFSLVVGMARHGEDQKLKKNGADVVVHKLTELQKELNKMSSGKEAEELPKAMDELPAILEEIGSRTPVLFLDYDGTLSPIVKNPEDAILDDKTRDIIRKLAQEIPLAVISGRDRADVASKVGLENIIYAGSHGFDITGPGDLNMQYEGGQKAIPALNKAEKALQEKLGNIKGAQVERKKYAIAVHYRNVAEEEVDTVRRAVYDELDRHQSLKKGGGKKILELKPDIDWHKGRATRWLLDALDLEGRRHIPVFIGDDVTDEDALEAIADDGIGILVGSHGEKTTASYRLEDTDEVSLFLEKLYAMLKEKQT